jgi:hypothetical protein
MTPPDHAAFVAALATVRAHVALLGEVLALCEARLAALEPVPPPPRCPHPEDARQDLATLAHPRRFHCRACGEVIEDVREVSHGRVDG